MEREKLFSLLSTLPKFQQTGTDQYKACCPAHQDKEPSLSIKFTEDRVLIFDFAKCSLESICNALGIESKDLFYGSNEKYNNYGQSVQAEYRYYDENGRYIYSKLRFATENGGKKMFCAVNTGTDYDYKNVPKERFLYKLSNFKFAAENGYNLVYIVEGEKDVETLSKLGMIATTSGSANSWKEEFAKHFKNLNVVILRDNDQAGLEYANAIVKSIYNLCANYKVLITSQQEKGDVTDYLEEGHSKEELLQLIDSIPFTPQGVIDKELIATKKETGIQAQKQYNFVSATNLFKTEFTPMKWAVKNLIPQGLTILASPPKYGKSWMCLDLCISVAKGEPFLGFETVKGACLYLALEDSLSRLKQRLKTVLQEKQPPDNFFMITSSPTISSGLIDMLQAFLTANTDTRLIIIDTFQKVRDGIAKNETLYQGDYRETGALKKFADDHGIAIVLIHHLRKMEDISDPFSRISGSNGITGATDSAIVLSKAKRTDDNTVMYSTGRDIEQKETVLSFNKKYCKWEILGDIGRVEYERSPVVQFIKTKIGYEGKTKDLWEEYNIQAEEIITQTMFGTEINKFASKFAENGIFIKRSRKTNGWFITIK